MKIEELTLNELVDMKNRDVVMLALYDLAPVPDAQKLAWCFEQMQKLEMLQSKQYWAQLDILNGIKNGYIRMLCNS